MRIAIDWKKRGREFLILTGVALFLAFLRPYGATDDAPFPVVFVFWWLLILVGSVIGETTVWALYKLRPDSPDWLMIIIVSAVTALGVTMFMFLMQAVSFGYISVGPQPVWILYFYVLVISVAMTLLGFVLGKAFNMAGPDFVHQADDREAIETFLERLPVKYRTAELYAVSSEDHYCRVHTSLGSELILMRLADADRELASVDGLRVHRSWWVSRKGIADSARESGKIVLKLKSGDEVPVSRSYQSAVKDAGLIH
ncbi:LytTR family DNA-binding domain-containing protein [Henriciella sp. AS95]|uniref:LytTR family DNA-binding domain-containing protein n=1 Tax=Henriciella sp. AS95 TaxID=3135782 RepID=UPI003173FCBA